jgi:hypothetical protein
VKSNTTKIHQQQHRPLHFDQGYSASRVTIAIIDDNIVQYFLFESEAYDRGQGMGMIDTKCVPPPTVLVGVATLTHKRDDRYPVSVSIG